MMPFLGDSGSAAFSFANYGKVRLLTWVIERREDGRLLWYHPSNNME